MVWKECKDLEKSIILCIHRKPLSITEIAKETKRAKPTISKTVERMEGENLITKTHQYKLDARKIEIQINKERVRIEKSHMFYLNHYIIIVLGLAITGIIAGIIKDFLFFLGSLPLSLAILLFLLYEVYVKEDKVTVYKNPKTIKKEIQKESEI